MKDCNETLIRDYFNRDAVGGDIGVEIELEATNRFPDRARTEAHWWAERDGSLKSEYALEYVLRKPSTVKETFTAIDSLKKELDLKGTNIIDTVRAGVHVHINVGDLTFQQMWTMTTVWYILEELLIDNYCGEGRSGNHFCLRAVDADAVVFRVVSVMEGRIPIDALGNDDIRYSSLNFCSLRKYGSLEFRAMRATKDLNKIKRWVKILYRVKKNSLLSPNPKHVVRNFSMGGEKNFLSDMIGKREAEYIVRNDLRYREKMRRGVVVAQELGYADYKPVKEKETTEFEKYMKYHQDVIVDILEEEEDLDEM